MDQGTLPGHTLDSLVEALLASYVTEGRTQRIDSEFMPNRNEVIEIIGDLRELLFPGFFSRTRLTADNIRYHVGELLNTASVKLHRQVYRSLRYNTPKREGAGDDHAASDANARRIVAQFLARLPEIRSVLATDVQAALDGDPAAKTLDEIIFAYPGLVAITTYRLAHELLELGVPLLPRIMTEWAHSATGIDIHPGAAIGPSFFIDHGTGVVIGETTHIGRNVQLYQSVTLGALNPLAKDEAGQLKRGQKRHPTIEDNVIIYSGASILGGATVIGRGAVVAGSVFLTKSVPPNTFVSVKAPDLKVRERRETGEPTPPAEGA